MMQSLISGLLMSKRPLSTMGTVSVMIALCLAAASVAAAHRTEPPYPFGAAAAAAAAGAASWSAGSMATSQATAGTFQGPAQAAPAWRSDAERANRARQREARAVRRLLVRQESEPARSLAECEEWAQLNEHYGQLMAGTGRSRRHNERAKAEECHQLMRVRSRAQDALDELRRPLLAERDQLAFVAGLLAEYLELTRRFAHDESLARAFSQMVEEEPEVRHGIHKLETLLEFARAESGAHYQDEVGALERDVRRLVDQERELDEEQLRLLTELADQLERALADGEQVNVSSGRYRYLSGVLDAARTVILHKLDEPAVVAMAPTGADYGHAYPEQSFYSPRGPVMFASSYQPEEEEPAEELSASQAQAIAAPSRGPRAVGEMINRLRQRHLAATPPNKSH